MKNGKVYLVGATKGGVGKSVSSYNLAYSLAKLGKKVLAVDFDSQANMSTCFGVRLKMKKCLRRKNLFGVEMVWISYHHLWCFQ